MAGWGQAQEVGQLTAIAPGGPGQLQKGAPAGQDAVSVLSPGCMGAEAADGVSLAALAQLCLDAVPLAVGPTAGHPQLRAVSQWSKGPQCISPAPTAQGPGVAWAALPGSPSPAWLSGPWLGLWAPSSEGGWVRGVWDCTSQLFGELLKGTDAPASRPVKLDFEGKDLGFF